jgi:hypothetical protein
MQALDPKVQRQVEHGLRSLSKEFEADVAPEAVWRAGRQRLRKVLALARFDDFIPVLVYRNVRERIIEQLQNRRPPTVVR